MKPIPIERKDVMDYNDIMHYIDNKYDIQNRDYKHKKDINHYEKYQKEMDDPIPFGNGVYPDTLEGTFKVYRNGEMISASKDEYESDFKLIHDQYKRYQGWCKFNPEPDNLDYWHWLLNNQFEEVDNGCTKHWNILEIINEKETPEWARTITQLVYDEFKDNCDDDGCLEVILSW